MAATASQSAAACCAHGAHEGFRCWRDKVMWSNMAYLGVSGHAFYVGVVDVGIVSVAVAFASTMYHLHAERCYLALDATFAGLVFLVAILCLIDSLRDEGPFHWMVVSSVLGFPLLIYLFVASDLPGTKHYDFYHTLWHFVTALGTVPVVVYLEQKTESRSAVELFCWEAFCCGVAFALACLWVMRDVVERTFFTHARKVVIESPEAEALGAVISADNEIFVRGCHVSSAWFWAGLAAQTAGTFAIYSTDTQDLAFLLAGASVCSFVYHKMQATCELALDLMLCAVSVFAVFAAVLHSVDHAVLAEWVVLGASLVLPAAFTWSMYRLSSPAHTHAGVGAPQHGTEKGKGPGKRQQAPAQRKPSRGASWASSPHGLACEPSCACFRVNAFISLLLDPVSGKAFWHHRFSHSFITACNVGAATLCLATALIQ